MVRLEVGRLVPELPLEAMEKQLEPLEMQVEELVLPSELIYLHFKDQVSFEILHRFQIVLY